MSIKGYKGTLKTFWCRLFILQSPFVHAAVVVANFSFSNSIPTHLLFGTLDFTPTNLAHSSSCLTCTLQTHLLSYAIWHWTFPSFIIAGIIVLGARNLLNLDLYSGNMKSGQVPYMGQCTFISFSHYSNSVNDRYYYFLLIRKQRHRVLQWPVET